MSWRASWRSVGLGVHAGLAAVGQTRIPGAGLIQDRTQRLVVISGLGPSCRRQAIRSSVEGLVAQLDRAKLHGLCTLFQRVEHHP
jgi:hypothetical protein